MEKLLASSAKVLNIRRGQEIEGEIVVKGDKELVLDLGTKSEGILSTRDFPPDQLETLKIGDKLKAYVSLPENESGQVVLTLHPTLPSRGSRSSRINWAKFIQAKSRQSKLNGKVIEVNKGGLMVEIDRVRGFLPNSQVGFEALSKIGEKIEDFMGQNLTVTVIEVDEAQNRLIFSQRGQVSAEVLGKLKALNNGQKTKGKIVAVLPFGLVVDVEGTEGLVFISDVSWEKVEDLQSLFKVGQQIEVLVIGIDEELGRLNLSIKQLTPDPFAKIAQEYSPDQVVKGEITQITDAGVTVALEGAEGFLPSSKMADTTYEVGQTVSFLVDSVDSQRRRINLAPFVTTTKGLIYK